MGRGKSWDAKENETLAHAWRDTWTVTANALAQAAAPVKPEPKDPQGAITSSTGLPEGVVVEVGSRAFSRAVHARFSAATPPPGTGPGRYAARSEQACKQHFADLANDIRRCGSTMPPPDSVVYGAWRVLHQHPHFTKPPQSSSRSPAPAALSRVVKPTPRIPAPSLDPGSITAGSDDNAGVVDDDHDAHDEEDGEGDGEGDEEDSEEITPAQPIQTTISPAPTTTHPQTSTLQTAQRTFAPAPTARAMPSRIRRTRKRPRQDDPLPSSAPALGAIDNALVNLAGAIRERAERQEEHNGFLAFSHPSAVETEQGRRDQLEYLTIMRRLCLNRARARAQQMQQMMLRARTAPTSTVVPGQTVAPRGMNE